MATTVAALNLGDDIEPGGPAVAEATRRAELFAARWGKRYPAAVKCVVDDLANLAVHLRFPAEHWRRIRHSNFISVNRPWEGPFAEAV